MAGILKSQIFYNNIPKNVCLYLCFAAAALGNLVSDIAGLGYVFSVDYNYKLNNCSSSKPLRTNSCFTVVE